MLLIINHEKVNFKSCFFQSACVRLNYCLATCTAPNFWSLQMRFNMPRKCQRGRRCWNWGFFRFLKLVTDCQRTITGWACAHLCSWRSEGFTDWTVKYNILYLSHIPSQFTGGSKTFRSWHTFKYHSAHLWWWESSYPSAVIVGGICIRSMNNRN